MNFKPKSINSDIAIKNYRTMNRNRYLIITAFTFLFVFVGISLFDADDFSGNFSEMVNYIVGDGERYHGFFPPDVSQSNLSKYSLALLDTLMMGFISLLISVPLGFVMSLFMSRNLLFFIFPGDSFIMNSLRYTIYTITISIANVTRSVNELVWALFFVSAIGLGPLSGVLALGIHSAGVMAKLLAERYEDINIDSVKSSKFIGHNFIEMFLYSILPQIKPHLYSTILYRFETDTRSASILGAVGAGGIGFYLFESLRNFDNQQVTTIILMIIFMVGCIDFFSARLRKKLVHL